MEMEKKKKVAAVVEFGIHSPQAERKRNQRRRKRLALQGIDLNAILKEKERKRREFLKQHKLTRKAKENAVVSEPTNSR
jgi:hypothetical protein